MFMCWKIKSWLNLLFMIFLCQTIQNLRDWNNIWHYFSSSLSKLENIFLYFSIPRDNDIHKYKCYLILGTSFCTSFFKCPFFDLKVATPWSVTLVEQCRLHLYKLLILLWINRLIHTYLHAFDRGNFFLLSNLRQGHLL